MSTTARTSTTNLHLRGERQPHPDSIVRVGGIRGTVYQRFVSDGEWHGTNGQVRSWLDLITKPVHVEVLYSASERLEVGAIYVNPVGDVFVIREDGSYGALRTNSTLALSNAWGTAYKVYSPAQGMIS